MSCNKCDVSLPENADFVTCSACEKKFHFDCSVRETKWRNMSVEGKRKWSCASCKVPSGVPRVNSAASVVSDSSSVAEDDVSVKLLLTQMNIRLNTLDEVKTSVDAMSKSLTFLSDRYDELLKEVRGYKKANDTLKKEVANLQAESLEKDKAIRTLTRRFNSLEQYGRGVNLEIHGLEQEHSEELADVVLKKVANAIQQPFDPRDIQAAHRLQAKKNGPPALLVQFLSKATKQKWLAAGRRRKLTSRDIVGAGDQRVFFNENLTPYFGRLFHETRLLARSKGYESVWVMNGTIRVKKRREDGSRPLVISDYEDLNLIV